jgi:hypothetical protein
MIRKAISVWRGSGRSGNGELSSDSGVLGAARNCSVSRVLTAEITLDGKLL